MFRSISLLVVTAIAAACTVPGKDTADPDRTVAALPRPDPLAGMIAFVSERTGQPELYAMRDDGTGLLRLTDGSLAQVDDPAVSLDGRRLAFTAVPPGGVRPDVFAMDADGSGLRQLTPDAPTTATRRGRRTAIGSLSRALATPARPRTSS